MGFSLTSIRYETAIRPYSKTSLPTHKRAFGFAKSAAKKSAIIGGTAGAAGIAVPVAGTAGLTAAGFTSTGIAAGSLAASIQGPAVVAGSTFATLQSIGATGGLAILGPVGLGAALICGGIAATVFGVKYLVDKKKRATAEKEENANAVKILEKIEKSVIHTKTSNLPRLWLQV